MENYLRSIQTEKSKLLNGFQEKTHSDHSRQIEDEKFLQQVHPKLVIAGPKTNNGDAWETLDSGWLPCPTTKTCGPIGNNNLRASLDSLWHVHHNTSPLLGKSR